MAKESVWLKNISPEVMDIYLADKNSTMMSQETGNVSAKTVSTKHCNSINLTISDVSYVPQLRCKLTRKTHHSIDISQSSQILELLHADLCGPINIESYGGAKYFMVIVDDFSGMYFAYFLKNKYEVFDIFSQFKAKYENLTKRIKKIRTDNGFEFVNEQLETYLANSGIFHEKTIPYNSESNDKAERANRALLERARSLLYESKLPLKFWAEAINCSTQVSNITPQKGKGKIPLEIWTGSRYLGEIENETWDIDSFFEVSPERNEINQNTENVVLSNFDINNVSIEIENDNSIPLQTTSSPQTGRIQLPVLELNDVQNQIPVRRSERLKSKQMSVHLTNNVPNSYFEAKNSANWQNWKLAMENELNSLDKHKVWEIVQKPAKSKLIKTKWVYSLKQDDAGENMKYKARLVAADFNQIKNIDYSESYSPVVNIEYFRWLIALAAKLKLNVNFFDVKTAYLYGDLEETVYVLPPPGYEKLIGDDKVCKLKKSIYGFCHSLVETGI
ncbi:retrovirus-related Pol polyprotein from transposon TNT 1-94 [Trichonephila clavipes]|nr:retrovirus-related Pol polyprotein from transposon TNT 1-94 [Trichonephila clavipes]